MSTHGQGEMEMETKAFLTAWNGRDRGIPAQDIFEEFCAALGTHCAPTAEPVAEIISKFGDTGTFGERELKLHADIQKLPIGTKLYAASPRQMTCAGRKK